MLLEEAIRMLLTATQVEGRSSQTVEWYRRRLIRLANFLGNIPVEQISAHDLRRYIIHLKEQKTRWPNHPKLSEREGSLSDETIYGHYRALCRLFNWLIEEEVLQTNPMRKIRVPKSKRHEPKGISANDLRALLETTKAGKLSDIRDRAIILFLADTACRVAGLCGLRVEDVDLEKGLALVKEKGNRARKVLFNPPTAKALEAWLKVRPQEYGSWLFVSLGNKAKGRLSTSGVRQMLRRRGKQAGIKGRISPHMFRHSFAREFLLNGGDLATLSDLLGHSSVAAVSYTHL
ncbi:MAG: tyrosine-type recombinase/integrase, partial [Anaerolineae bacterium]|nr:tyrosine-type recombinase/integrase [Anaerolineae bacterium]